MTENLEHQIKDKITYITINDPKNGNRVSDVMAQNMTLQIDEASKSSKAIVLKTKGSNFCLGRAVMGEAPGKLPEAYEMRQKFDIIFDFYDAFRRSKIPVIIVK